MSHDKEVRVEGVRGDVVAEARAKLAKPGHGMGHRNRYLITKLCDELEQARKQTAEDNAAFDELMAMYKKEIGAR